MYLHSFIHFMSCMHSLISFNHSFIISLISFHSFNHFIHSLINSLFHSFHFMNSFIKSLISDPVAHGVPGPRGPQCPGTPCATGPGAQEQEQEEQDTSPAQGPGTPDNSRTASHTRHARHEHGTRLPGWRDHKGLTPPTSDEAPQGQPSCRRNGGVQAGFVALVGRF